MCSRIVEGLMTGEFARSARHSHGCAVDGVVLAALPRRN
jgi:hypothetical protein